MAESEEELKSLLIKVKNESEKAALKLNIQKTKIMASDHKSLQRLPTYCFKLFSPTYPTVFVYVLTSWIAISFLLFVF